MRRTIVVAAAFALIAGLGLGAAWYLRFVFAGQKPEAYIARIGPGASFIAAGDLTFDGEHFTCAGHPTVFNPGISDYGAAFFGFVVLNPSRFGLLPITVKRFAYAHECGHQYVGYSELYADCYAVKRGLAAGWLGLESLEEVCAFFSKSKGTALHLLGPRRCAAIRACYQSQREKD
jgi:hypothetical protein